MPGGPVAQPVTTGVTSARVQITVAPLGFIRYDTQTLPLVSPDGRHLAVQQGEPPTWDTLLATDRQEPADGVRISVIALDAGLGRGVHVPQLPAGAFLGRDASAEGFLVESVRPDGARWIGLVSWTTQEVRWLVQGDGVASHAAFVDGSLLVYSRRERGAPHATIAFRDGTGHESVLSEAAPGSAQRTYVYPTPSPDGTVIFACAVSPGAGEAPTRAAGGTLDLAAVRVVDDGRRAGGKRLGAFAAQRPLGAFADVAVAAHQAFASLQPSAWCGPLSADARASIVFTHPGRGRAAAFSPLDTTLTWLAEKSVCAAAWTGRNGEDNGYFCTAPRELVFQPRASAETTRILPAPYVPRVVTVDGVPALILFGPSKQRQDELEVLRVGVGASP
jgi:hypothetical protein